jgi:4-hydroxy-2-oxoheptanedioate aldolase
MGHENRWSDPPVQAAIDSALRDVARAGICPGTLAFSQAEEDRYGAVGARFFCTVASAVITQALAQAARRSNPAAAPASARSAY